MYTRKEALKLAKRYRTCPPPEIRSQPFVKELLNRHLEICPYCSLSGFPEYPAGEEKRNALKKEEKGGRGPYRIRPGDLRPIRGDFAVWRNGFFYSPPLVLVIGPVEGFPDAVRVAQTYPDIYLAGPGDLILNSGPDSTETLFVEPWNMYTLHRRFLGPKKGAVSGKALEAALTLGKDPQKLPDWGILTHPMAEEDPRIYFRELEAEVGYVFARQAADELMADFEKKTPRLAYDTARALQSAMKRAEPDLTWNKDPLTLHEAVALAEFPPEMLMMAASAEEGRISPAGILTVKDGKLIDFKPARVEIMYRGEIPGGVGFSGRVRDMPQEASTVDLICLLDLGDRRAEPSAMKWEASSGRFYVEFVELGANEAAQGELLAALIAETDL